MPGRSRSVVDDVRRLLGGEQGRGGRGKRSEDGESKAGAMSTRANAVRDVCGGWRNEERP